MWKPLLQQWANIGTIHISWWRRQRMQKQWRTDLQHILVFHQAFQNFFNNSWFPCPFKCRSQQNLDQQEDWDHMKIFVCSRYKFRFRISDFAKAIYFHQLWYCKIQALFLMRFQVYWWKLSTVYCLRTEMLHFFLQHWILYQEQKS